MFNRFFKSSIMSFSSTVKKGIIDPKTIVVVGGTDNMNNPGGTIVKNLADFYDGDVFIVNPKAEGLVQGYPSFKSIVDLPSMDESGNKMNYDLGILSVPARFVNDSVRDLIEMDIDSFICVSAGFGEVGEKEREQELLDLVNDNDCGLIGPNCIGVFNENYVGSFLGMGKDFMRDDGVDFVTSSGALGAYFFEQAIRTGLKCRSVYSIGNAPQNGIEEILEHWSEEMTLDPNKGSKIKLIYAEDIRQPEKFYEHVKSLGELGCTCVVLKSGISSSGQRAAASHTGAMASSNLYVDQFFDELGVIRCENRNDMISLAKTLYYLYNFNGNVPLDVSSTDPFKVGVVTQAGGPGVLLVDALEGKDDARKIEIPYLGDQLKETLLPHLDFGSSVSNPIDFLSRGTVPQVELCLDTMNELNAVDVMAFIYGDPGFFDVSPVIDCISERLMETAEGKRPKDIPFFFVFPSLISSDHSVQRFFEKSGFPYFDDEVDLGKALKKIVIRSQINKSINKVPDVSEKIRETINWEYLKEIVDSLERNVFIDPLSLAKIFDALNVPQVEYSVCTELKDCLDFFNDHKNVAMKVVGPVHKSDSQGVVLNVKTAEQVEEEFNRLMNIKDSEGVLMQKMIESEGYREMFIGSVQDHRFGPIVLYGLGGTEVEVFKSSVGGMLTHFDENLETNIDRVRKTIEEKEWGTFFEEEFRGKKGMNLNQFVEIVGRIGLFVEEFKDTISEIDLNPLLFTQKDGFIVVDGRIKTKE